MSRSPDKGTYPQYLDDEPPGALMILAVLLGQMDGRVEISDRALMAVRPMRVAYWRNEDRYTYTVQLEPDKP